MIQTEQSYHLSSSSASTCSNFLRRPQQMDPHRMRKRPRHTSLAPPWHSVSTDQFVLRISVEPQLQINALAGEDQQQRKLQTRPIPPQAQGHLQPLEPTQHHYQSNLAAASLARGPRRSSRSQPQLCDRAANLPPPNRSASFQTTAWLATRSQRTTKKKRMAWSRTGGGGARFA
jgi:hypothetical protein